MTADQEPRLNPRTSDQEIVEDLLRGSPDAFRKLYEHNGSAVFAYLTRLTGRREMAEELTQETFLTAIRKIGFFKAGADGGLKAWVFRIATNLAIDTLRREKRVEISSVSDAALIEQPDDCPNPHDQLETLQTSRSFSAAILELAPAQRLVFLLKEQEDMSLVDISRICGLSINAIKQSLFRARAALRKKLCE